MLQRFCKRNEVGHTLNRLSFALFAFQISSSESAPPKKKRQVLGPLMLSKIRKAKRVQAVRVRKGKFDIGQRAEFVQFGLKDFSFTKTRKFKLAHERKPWPRKRNRNFGCQQEREQQYWIAKPRRSLVGSDLANAFENPLPSGEKKMWKMLIIFAYSSGPHIFLRQKELRVQINLSYNVTVQQHTVPNPGQNNVFANFAGYPIHSNDQHTRPHQPALT